MARSMKSIMGRFGDAARIILRDLVRDRWRTLITITNLFMFLCCFFCLAALAKAAQEYGKQGSNKNSLMVIEKNVFDPSDSQITLEQFAPILELQPQKVEHVTPLIFQLMKVGDYLIQVRAAPLEDFEPVFDLKLLEGQFPKLTNEVVIGENTALQTKWKVGQSIRIFGKDFTITGIISSPGTKASSIWLGLPAAEELFGTHDLYQFAWIQVRDDVDSRKVMDLLNGDPRINKSFDVYFVDYLYAQYSQGLEDLATLGTLLVILSLAIVMFGTYGTTFLTLAERNRDITILRAVGFGSRAVRSLLLLRTSLQLIAAYLLAAATSTVILDLLQRQHPLTVHSIPLDVRIDAGIFWFGLFLSLVFGGIGVLIPTLKLKQASVREAVEQ